MFSSLLKPVILRFLSDYVEDSDQHTGVEVSLGSVSFENLSLKPAAITYATGLDQMLPVEIASIKAAALKLDLPLTRISSRAGVISITDLVLTLNWLSESRFDETEMSKVLAQAAIDNALYAWEVAQGKPPPPAAALAALYLDLSSMLNRTLIRTLDNIKLTGNVKLRIVFAPETPAGYIQRNDSEVSELSIKRMNSGGSMSQIDADPSVSASAAASVMDDVLFSTALGTDEDVLEVSLAALEFFTCDDDGNEVYNADAQYKLRKRLVIKGIAVTLISSGGTTQEIVLPSTDLDSTMDLHTNRHAEERFAIHVDFAPTILNLAPVVVRTVMKMLADMTEFTLWVQRVERRRLQQAAKSRSPDAAKEYLELCTLRMAGGPPVPAQDMARAALETVLTPTEMWTVYQNVLSSSAPLPGVLQLFALTDEAFDDNGDPETDEFPRLANLPRMDVYPKFAEIDVVFPQIPPETSLGIELEERGADVVVTSVAPDSPLQGIKPGMVLLGCHGYSFSPLTIEGKLSMLNAALRPCIVRFRRVDEKTRLSLNLAQVQVNLTGLQSFSVQALGLFTTSGGEQSIMGLSWSRVELSSGLLLGLIEPAEAHMVSNARGQLENVKVGVNGGNVELAFGDMPLVEKWTAALDLPPPPLHAPPSSSPSESTVVVSVSVVLQALSVALRVQGKRLGARVDKLGLTTEGGNTLKGALGKLVIFADGVAELAVPVPLIELGLAMDRLDVGLGAIDFDLSRNAYVSLVDLMDCLAAASSTPPPFPAANNAAPMAAASSTNELLAPRRNHVKRVVVRALNTVLGYDAAAEDRVALTMDNALEFHRLLDLWLGRTLTERVPLDLVLVQETAQQVWDSVTLTACSVAHQKKVADDGDDADKAGMQLSVVLRGADVTLFGLLRVRLGLVRMGQCTVNKTTLSQLTMARLSVTQLSDGFELCSTSTPPPPSLLPVVTSGGGSPGAPRDFLKLSYATGPRDSLAHANGTLNLTAPCRALDLAVAHEERVLAEYIEHALYKELVALQWADEELPLDVDRVIDAVHGRCCAALRTLHLRDDVKPPGPDAELMVKISALHLAMRYSSLALLTKLSDAMAVPSKASSSAAVPAIPPPPIGGFLLAMELENLQLCLEDASAGTKARAPFSLVVNVPRASLRLSLREALERVQVNWEDLSVGVPEHRDSLHMPTVIHPWSAWASLQLNLARKAKTDELERLVVAEAQTLRVSVLLRDAPDLLEVLRALPTRLQPSNGGGSALSATESHPLGEQPQAQAAAAAPAAHRALSAALGLTVSDTSNSFPMPMQGIRETAVRVHATLLEVVVQDALKFRAGIVKIKDAFLPVMMINATKVHLSMWTCDTSKDTTVSLLASPYASFYNARLALWEPLVESFRAQLRFLQCDDSVLGKHTSLCVLVDSRVNVNFSEDAAKLVIKLAQDVEKQASKPLIKVKPPRNALRRLGRAHSAPDSSPTFSDQYVIVNKTGDDIIVSGLEQVGCTARGLLKVRVRDGWSLPQRARWRNEPHVRCELLPSRLPPVEAGDDQRLWGQNAVELSLEYPGAGPNQSLPELLIEVTNQALSKPRECRVKLAPYIVSPGTAVDEWHRLAPAGQTSDVDGEIFLQIVFESHESECEPSRTFAPLVCHSSSAVSLNFHNVPNHWEDEINHLDIMTRLEHLGTTSLRRAQVTLANQLGAFKLPVDDTGRYAIPVKIASTQMDLIVKAAMRTDFRRIIKIKSPVVVKNLTNDPMELLLCDSSAVDNLGEAHYEFPELKRIMEDDDVTMDFSGDRLSERGTGVEMVMDGLMESVWVDGGYSIEDVETADDAHKVTFVQFEFARPRCVEFFRVGLPRDWSVAEPPTMVLLFGRKDLASGFDELVSLPVEGVEGELLFVETHIPAPDFYKIYRFELLGVEGEPGSDAQRGPGGDIAVGISYLYLYENPAKLAASGDWVCQTCEERLPNNVNECSLCGTVRKGVIPANRYTHLESFVKNRLALNRDASLGVNQSASKAELAASSPGKTPPSSALGTRNVDLDGEDEGVRTRKQRLRGDPLVGRGRNPKLKEGTVLVWKKRSTTSGDWKHRWVILFHDQIAIYRRRPGLFSDDQRPNFIATFQFTKDVRVVQKSALRRYSFEFFGIRPNQVLVLACTSEKDFIDWIKLVDLTITQFRKGGGGQGAGNGNLSTMVLQPKTSFAVPLQFLATSEDGQAFCLCIRPAIRHNGLPLKWAVVADNLSSAFTTLPVLDRSWLVCPSVSTKSRFSISSLAVQRAPSLGGATEQVEQKITRVYSSSVISTKMPFRDSLAHTHAHKVYLVPWLKVQNALPYPITWRFVDNLTARRPEPELAPGDTREISSVGKDILIQFKLPIAEAWSDPVQVYREDASKRKTTPMGTRSPLRSEVVKFDTDRITLELERSNDAAGHLRLILFASCWAYNYSDVTMLIRTSKLFSVSDAMKDDGTYDVLPAMFQADWTRPLLPALLNAKTQVTVLAALKEDSWRDAAPDVGPGVEGEQHVYRISNRAVSDNIVTSGNSVHVKFGGVSANTHAFVFRALNQVVIGRKAVCIEVRRGSHQPFNRSVQLIFRTKFVVVNAVQGLPLIMREKLQREDIREQVQDHLLGASPGGGDNSTEGATSLPPNESRCVPFHFSWAVDRDRTAFILRADTTRWSGMVDAADLESDRVVCLRSASQSLRRDNGAVHLRVSARTTGQTTFIVLSADNPTTLRLDNRCVRWAIEVRQESSRDFGNVVLKPASSLEFGWDQPMTDSTIKMRALQPLTGGDASPLRSGFFQRHSHREVVVESGDDNGERWVPASPWVSYEVETVSEKESLESLDEEGASIRVEGFVNGKTRVLTMSEPTDSASMVDQSKVVIEVEVPAIANLPRLFNQSYLNHVHVSMGGKSKLTFAPSAAPLRFELDDLPHSLLINLLSSTSTKAVASARVKLAVLQLIPQGQWILVRGEEWLATESELDARKLAIVLRNNRGLESIPRKGFHLLRTVPEYTQSEASVAVSARAKKRKKHGTPGVVELAPTAAKSASLEPVLSALTEDDDIEAQVRGAMGRTKKWPTLTVRLRVLRRPERPAETTKLKLGITSLGTSLMYAARRKELCYLTMQRVWLSLRTRERDSEIRARLGSVQLDSFVDGRYPIAFRPERPRETVLSVNLVWYSSTIDVLFVERVRIVARRLEVAVEEPFIAAVVDVAASGALASALKLMEGNEVSTHPVMEAANVASTDSSTGVRMFYVDALDISNTRVNIRLDLNGGHQLQGNTDELSGAIAVYLPVLEVDSLLLRFAGMSRTGIFESEAKLKRRLYEHYAVEALQNSHKLLTNVSYLGNPAQAGRKFATGFFHFVKQPISGLSNRGTFSGFVGGLQSGFTVLVANMTSGLTETVHGMSLAITSAYNFMEQSGAHDVTIRPIASAVAVIRDVSGAVAQGANEISIEVIDHDDQAKATWVREPRPFSQQGAVLEYGGGGHPLVVEQRIERASARRLVLWWRRILNRAHGNERGRLGDVVLSKEEEMMRMRRARLEEMRGRRRRLRWLQDWCGSLGTFLDQCFGHVKNVYREEVAFDDAAVVAEP